MSESKFKPNFLTEAGLYTVCIDKVAEKVSKLKQQDDGTVKGGNPMLMVQYKTLEGKLVSDFLMLQKEPYFKEKKKLLTENAEKTLYFIKKALGVDSATKITDCIGKSLKIQTEKNGEYLNIAARMSVDGTETVDETGAEDIPF